MGDGLRLYGDCCVKTIDFYFDFWSPYAYLGSHRIGEIAEKHGCAVNYLPVDIGRVKLAAGNTGPANLEIKPKIRYLMQDLKRWADIYGLAFGAVPKGKDTRRINKGVFFAQERNAARDYVREAYAAVWGQGGDPTSDELLSNLARKMGWDADEFLAYVNSAASDERYEQVYNTAVERGVFGVPITIIDGQMWWGNDRLQFVDEYLTKNA